jgi:hypothetical protein
VDDLERTQRLRLRRRNPLRPRRGHQDP